MLGWASSRPRKRSFAPQSSRVGTRTRGEAGSFGRGVESVAGDPIRLVAEVGAPRVRGEDAEAGRGERLDLMAPAVPEFGEAMEEDHERAPFGARLDRVQTDAVGGDRPVPRRQ